MSSCSVLILIVSGGACAQNLLVNPSFESLDGAMPARWHLFVMPQPGAEGRLEDQACEGQFAAVLHNAGRYEKEPANNWSQNVIADLGGKTLRLSGCIKTEDATEAALWLQCWSRPWRLRHFATTSADMPVYGTQDWTSVSVAVEVPKETDFVVVRCVLLGSGTAWFDALALEEAGRAAQEPDEGESEEAADSDPAEADHSEMTESLVEANIVLADTVQELRETHDALAEQVRQLEGEVEHLREQLAPPPAPAEHPPREAPFPVPPLVPHGYDLKDLCTW